jgi:hypothetical protein
MYGNPAGLSAGSIWPEYSSKGFKVMIINLTQTRMCIIIAIKIHILKVRYENYSNDAG